MPEPILLRQDQGAVAQLTLNAPQKLNALSDTMLAALSTQIEALRNDTTIRVVVLKGAGKAFCAGHDLREMQAGRGAADAGVAYFQSLFDRCTQVMLGLQSLPQIVIAQVQGVAAAAGCQLVASCDLAIAASDSRFGVNGVNIGLFCSTPMVALSRKIPRGLALEMLTTGEFIDASRAREAGLINRIAAAEALEAEAQAFAATIAGKLGLALRIGKAAFYTQSELPTAEAYAYAGRVMVENALARDTAEGMAAFVEKRKPDWA
jgi:enoyl-CoA hydratase/carnithine racemase